MKIKEIKTYQVIDNSGNVIGTFADRDHAEKFLEAMRPSIEDQILDTLRVTGFKIGRKTASGVNSDYYYPLSKDGQKAQLWNCGARGWQICHPSQHDPAKLPEPWLEVFDFDLDAWMDDNGIFDEAA
jgi:hypothetical protein